ncbi:hypothetical protein BH09PSE5_BH09PSE5_05290 [soil metagenome]
MIPTISQQLKAIKTRIEESVIPELPAESKFAREQASFIVTTLEWMLDTHEHEYRYEVVENVEYRDLLQAMLKRNIAGSVDPSLLAEAKSVIDEKGPSRDEAVIPLRDVLQQNRRLKQAAMSLYTALSANCGARDNPTRDLVSDVSIGQGRRELAFFKKTGWVKSQDDLGVLLGERSSERSGEAA